MNRLEILINLPLCLETKTKWCLMPKPQHAVTNYLCKTCIVYIYYNRPLTDLLWWRSSWLTYMSPSTRLSVNEIRCVFSTAVYSHRKRVGESAGYIQRGLLKTLLSTLQWSQPMSARWAMPGLHAAWRQKTRTSHGGCSSTQLQFLRNAMTSRSQMHHSSCSRLVTSVFIFPCIAFPTVWWISGSSG